MYERQYRGGVYCAVDKAGTIVYKSLYSARVDEFIRINNKIHVVHESTKLSAEDVRELSELSASLRHRPTEATLRQARLIDKIISES